MKIVQRDFKNLKDIKFYFNELSEFDINSGNPYPINKVIKYQTLNFLTVIALDYNLTVRCDIWNITDSIKHINTFSAYIFTVI